VEYDGPWLQLLLVMTFHRAREKGSGDISPLDRDGSSVAIDPIFFYFLEIFQFIISTNIYVFTTGLISIMDV
jgi:hypothetical protein